MNPSTDPQLPPLPHRSSSTSCLRHPQPQEHFTGFCPLCLCERLSQIDSISSSSAKKPPTATSTAASALKAIFKPTPPPPSGLPAPVPSTSNRTRPSFFPELRRTKSFSASKNEGFSGVFEPQRKSCDVRARNTLWSLFTQDDGRNPSKKEPSRLGVTEITSETTNLEPSSSSLRAPVFEAKQEEASNRQDSGEIGVFEEPSLVNVIENRVEEIVEEEEEEIQEIQEELEPESVQDEEELKTMKDHIDLDSQTKKPSGRDLKEIAGSFWSAASVFSKKLQKWRDKQKVKKQRNGGGSTTLPVEKPIGRHFRETQSEIADYGFGRRSCDTDPRFSLDAGRMSFDDPRYSFDEPRASWDGYLISRTFQRMPTMLSVVEDAPVNVFRSDTQIPVEESVNSTNEDENTPGGSSQTRDYYSDSSSRRRKSLDRSNSIRKTAAAVVAEIDEMKSASNAKVSLATADICQAPKLAIPDRDSRDSNSNSLRDDCSGGTLDTVFNDSNSIIGTTGNRKESKKSRRWGKGWNIWGLINRRSGTGNKEEVEDRYSRPNGVERSYSESWPELRGERNSDGKTGFNPKMFRSNSSVSWRNSDMIGAGGTFSSSRRSNAETNGNGNGNGNGKKKKEEFVLERNRSARQSPTEPENGLLRFYLTPMRGSRRSGSGKVKQNQAQSIARSVLRLY